MPEDVCVEFIQKYSDEKKRLAVEIETLETKLTETVTYFYGHFLLRFP